LIFLKVDVIFRGFLLLKQLIVGSRASYELVPIVYIVNSQEVVCVYDIKMYLIINIYNFN